MLCVKVNGADETSRRRVLLAAAPRVADTQGAWDACVKSEDRILHVGDSPYTAASLHRKLETWRGDILSNASIKRRRDVQKMMDDFIAFYKEEAASEGYPGFEKAMRGWARDNRIPFTAPQ